MLLFRSFLLALLFSPVYAWPAQLMIAIPSGQITVNGTAMIRSSAVFPGDVIATGTNSVAVLQSRGSSVQIGPVAKCIVGRSGIELASGTATVHGIVEVVASNDLNFRSTAEASFVVTRQNGAVAVTVLKGTVSVHHGRVSESVKIGETQVFEESSTAPAAQSSHSKRALFFGIAFSEAATAIIISRLGERPGCISSGGAKCDFRSATRSR